MARVLAIDCGLTAGWGAIGDGPVLSGSYPLPGSPRRMGVTGRFFDEWLRGRILKVRPTAIAIAAPFVGSKGGKPVRPDSIRPLFGLLTVTEMVAAELQLECYEVDESAARRAFLARVPRKSVDIKAAVIAGCLGRDWPCLDHHAGDALCVASYVFEHLTPGAAHAVTPLFGDEPCQKDAPTQAESRPQSAGG